MQITIKAIYNIYTKMNAYLRANANININHKDFQLNKYTNKNMENSFI